MSVYEPINIYCACCGASARFDIAKQIYRCQYCGGETGIREPLEEKRGFRNLHRENMAHEKRNYPLVSCACTGCGATVVFPENEALSNCAFCGRSLARQEYLGIEGFPELLVPFKITEDEARKRLLEETRGPGCTKADRRAPGLLPALRADQGPHGLRRFQIRRRAGMPLSGILRGQLREYLQAA